MGNEQVPYVSEAIKDEYKKWNYERTIFIKTPTGSGKSTFILNNLLEHVISINKKILYLVNRKILEKQLNKEVDDVANNYDYTINIKNHIDILTYQKIENLLVDNSISNYINYFNSFDFIVYDECHYFFCDAAFNTLTELSYDFLRDIYDTKVQIFLSATMDNVEPIFKKRKKIYIGADSARRYLNKPETFDNIKSDYSYINIKLLEDKDDLVEKILNNSKNEKEKWLIFVDSISYGNKLYQEIQNNCKEVLFIDAKFKNNIEAKEAVNNIVKEKHSKKILITTSVMDNGISLEDEYLRNIVIMADTEETFIQMLGRKRIKNNKEKLNLYIFKRNKSYFTRKVESIEKILDFYKNYYNSYYNDINNYYDYNGYNNFLYNNVEYIKTNFNKDLFMEILLNPYVLNQKGFIKNPNMQQALLNDLLNNSIKYEEIYKKLFYSYAGNLEFNSFSVEYYKYLMRNYQDIINNLEKDEYYFVEKQLSWLGISKNSKKAKELFNNLDENHKINLIQMLNDVKEKTLSSDENKQLKLKIRKDLEYFLKKCKLKDEDNTLIKNATRKDAPISDETFNKCMIYIEKFIGLKYIMYKPSESEFEIKISQ